MHPPLAMQANLVLVLGTVYTSNYQVSLAQYKIFHQVRPPSNIMHYNCIIFFILIIIHLPLCTLHIQRVSEKLDLFSYFCFDSYELHENVQKHIGGVACCKYEINVCDSLTNIC